jgi:hypothetical protein
MTPARKRKRRGRPPGRSVRKKSEVFSTRMTPETRALLEEAAQASGKSFSQVFEDLVQGSFKSAGVRSGLDKLPDHVQALAVFVAMLTEQIETQTRRSWRTDPEVCQAITGALGATFLALGPEKKRLPTSLDETNHWYKSISAGMGSAQQYGVLEACLLLGTDDARLAWIREKLGIQNPRDWNDLMRSAQENFRDAHSALTEPKYAGKKS